MKPIHSFESFSNANEGSKLDHTPEGIEDSIVSGIAEWAGMKNTELGKLIYNDRLAQSALRTFKVKILA